MQTIINNINNLSFNFTTFINESKPKGLRVKLHAPDIPTYILNNNYSATIFKYNRRKKLNAQNTKIIVLDIDEPQNNYSTINDLQDKIKDFNHALAPTKSHRILKNGVICDRYRILFFLAEDVKNAKHYSEQVKQISNYFNLKHDHKCIDLGRLFFRSTEIASCNFNGKSFIPTAFTSETSTALIEEKFEYRLATCPIPKEIETWINRKELGQRITSKREKLIRMLICQKFLLSYNPLPLEYVSKYLNIKRNTLKGWLDDLIKHGWLSIFSDEYGKGWKSKSYSAHSELAKTIMSYHGYQSRRDCYREINLPNSIKDGEWNDILFLCAFKFSTDENPDGYINWVKTIKGWDQKTRLAQALTSFKSVKAYTLNLNK